MRFFVYSFGFCITVVLSAVAWAADKHLSPPAETTAEKLRQALDRVRDLEIADLPLDQAVNQLREQTGLNLTIDKLDVPLAPSAGPGGVVINIPSFAHLRLRGEFHDVPLRTALTKLLGAHNLTHVLVGDTVLITSKDKAADRQLGQTVSVKIEGTPLREELKRLARETGANLVLDPRTAKEGQTALSLRLDEVPLETAVEILANESGLSTVRLNNVLYVTSEARAKALRKPQPAATPSTFSWRVWPDGKGGFRMTAPEGAGIGGGGNFGGLGGIGGIAGLGGGGFNQLGVGGGFGGRMVAPVPLTPPLPKAKPAAPDKPLKEALPAKPAVVPDDKEKQTPKEIPQAQAIRPRILLTETRGKTSSRSHAPAWERKSSRSAARPLTRRDAERPDVRSHAGAWERDSL